MGEITERRKYKRFRAKDGVCAVLKPGSNIIGQIVNFSKGGLCFRYLFNADQVKSRKSDEMCLRHNGVSIDMLPCKTVCDIEVSEKSNSPGVKTRQRSVMFGELSRNKATQLDCFLRFNASA